MPKRAGGGRKGLGTNLRRAASAWSVVVALTLLWAAGCAGERSCTASRAADRAGLLSPAELRLLEQSNAWARAKSLATHPAFMLEERLSDGVELSVGDNHEERFETYERVRLSETRGRVERLSTDAAGELVWVDDAVPPAGGVVSPPYPAPP